MKKNLFLCRINMEKKWSLIANYLPGRFECQVKNRYYEFLKDQL